MTAVPNTLEWEVVVKDLNTTHMIRVPVSADEGSESAPTTYLSSEIVENTTLVAFRDIAVHDESCTVRALDQGHVALPDVDEVDRCIHRLYLGFQIAFQWSFLISPIVPLVNP